MPNLPGVFSMSLHQTAHLIDAAVVISIVGFVESVVVAKEFSAKHHYQVSSNRELLALGASNIAASFFRVHTSPFPFQDGNVAQPLLPQRAELGHYLRCGHSRTGRRLH